MKKSVYKRPWFWIVVFPVLVFLIFTTPAAWAYLRFYLLYPIHQPEPNTLPEEFHVLPDPFVEEKEFEGVSSVSPELVSIDSDEKTGRMVVRHFKDEYVLNLDHTLEVFTRKIEGNALHVKDKTGCHAVISFDPENKSIQMASDSLLKIVKEDPWMELLDFRLEKIKTDPFEAYLHAQNTDTFGVEEVILIQGKNGVYSISEVPSICSLKNKLLNGFSLMLH